MYFSEIRKLNVGQIKTWVVLAIAALAFSNQGVAQQFMFQADGGDKDALAKQFTEQLAAQSAAASLRLSSRIADINRACDLSESQLKKLEIAAKGAVKASMKEAKSKMVEQAKMMGVDFDPDADDQDADDQEADDQEAEEAEEGAPAVMAANVIRRVVINGRPANPNNSAEDQKLWKSSVKKVLNDEQAKQWEKWLEDREAYQTQIAVGSFVAQADRRLLLSGEQRERLAAHLGQKHGELFRKRAARQGGQFAALPVFIGNRMNNAADNEDNDEVDPVVEKILGKNQLKLWMKEFAPKLIDNGGAVRVGGAFNFNVNGAALNIVERVEVQEADEEDADDDQ